MNHLHVRIALAEVVITPHHLRPQSSCLHAIFTPKVQVPYQDGNIKQYFGQKMQGRKKKIAFYGKARQANSHLEKILSGASDRM